MSESSIEKLALMVAELMQKISRMEEAILMLRKHVLDLRDTCRGCAGYQDDGQ